MYRVVVLLFIFLCISGTAWAESYICTPQAGAGILNEDGKWTGQEIDMSGVHWVLKPLVVGGDNPPIWQVYQTGKDVPVSTLCSQWDSFGYLRCGGYISFEFSKETGRFLLRTSALYVHPPNPTDSTPSIVVGTCMLIEGAD